MQIGMTVAEPMIYEFFVFENRVQSEKRSAAPPYVPALLRAVSVHTDAVNCTTYTLLMHCTKRNARAEADRATAGATMSPTEPPFVCTAQPMIPKTVAIVP